MIEASEKPLTGNAVFPPLLFVSRYFQQESRFCRARNAAAGH
jgi:hypothetical protein